MSNTQNVRRRPWWIVGGNLLSSIVLTVLWGALSVTLLVDRLARTGGLDLLGVLLILFLLVLLVAGVASIVHYKRVPGEESPRPHPQESDPNRK